MSHKDAFAQELPIVSHLEGNRVADLELVLTTLTEKFVEYVKKADSAKDGSVGYRTDPRELRTKLNITVGEHGEGASGLFAEVDKILDNSTVTWNEGFLDKLYASNNPVGVASDMLLSILNTNSHVFTVSPAITVIEKVVAREYAKLFGLGPTSGGLTFPGGTYSNMTSLHMAKSLLYPDTKLDGNGNYNFAIFASKHCHYSVEKSAIFCGLGTKSVVSVEVNEKGQMNVDDLKKKIEACKKDGSTPLYINATAGTTVYGSFDDLTAIAEVASEHKIWLHVDGSWGGNVIWSEKQKHKLSGSHRANSITVNPHKMLGVPCTCSFLLVHDEGIFQQANSLKAPYLFHSNAADDDDNFDLADGTMGCGRRADAVKFYLAWKWYGSQGFGERVDHAFKVTEYFSNKINNTPGFFLVSESPPPCLQTCFYYNPYGKLATNGDENTQITRYISQTLHEQGKFLIDYAPHGEGKGEFFRVVVNSPIVSSETIDRLVDSIQAIGKSWLETKTN